MALLVSGSSLADATLVGIVVVTWMSGKMAKLNAVSVFVALLFGGWLWGVSGLFARDSHPGDCECCLSAHRRIATAG